MHLYESYINKALMQQYSLAFTFFVAICKQYPFKKIEEYCNYITYKYAFRHLFKPYLKRAFKKLRKNFYDKRKIEFLARILNQIYKKNSFKKIKIFSNAKGFINKLIKSLLKSSFAKFKKSINLIAKIKNNNNKINKKIETKKENKNKNEDLEIKDDEDNLDLSDYELFQKKKNDDNSVKMNSYLYESFGSDSKSLTVEPNSENNDRLHKLKMMLLIKNNMYNDEESVSNSLNNSAQKITSKKIKDK